LILLASLASTGSATLTDTEVESRLDTSMDQLAGLFQQVMRQQDYMEERLRSSGYSGIKKVRVKNTGTRSYYTTSHANQETVQSMRDHAGHARKVGMGEVVAVMNGIQFRTGNNDFYLNRPHRTSQGYHDVEPIELPPVPNSVVQLAPNVTAQIAEMKKYFEAYAKKDKDIKSDYDEFFYTVLCYLEGHWAPSNERDGRQETDEVRFAAATGRDSDEYVPYRPKKMIRLNGVVPEFARWNHRIVCAPTKKPPGINLLFVGGRLFDEQFMDLREDLSVRIANHITIEDHKQSRRARFVVNDSEHSGTCTSHYCTIDSMMYRIPGKNNYPARFNDAVFGEEAFIDKNHQNLANTARYHRFYKSNQVDQVNQNIRLRSYHDANLYYAETTHHEVASAEVAGEGEAKRWTYAIPLEMIVLTPLSTWNPYNLLYHDANTDSAGYEAVNAGNRNGGLGTDTAYDGIRDDLFFQTPAEFFETGEFSPSSDDTTPDGVIGVLDQSDNVQRVVASGIRTFLPSISGVGNIRTRYPIAPLHIEGNQIYMETEALTEVTMNMQTHADMFVEAPVLTESYNPFEELSFWTGMNARGTHRHHMTLTRQLVDDLKADPNMVHTIVMTDSGATHEHGLDIKYDASTTNGWVILTCDNEACENDTCCFDKHPNYLTEA